jgi:hypothetical protein
MDTPAAIARMIDRTAQDHCLLRHLHRHRHGEGHNRLSHEPDAESNEQGKYARTSKHPEPHNHQISSPTILFKPASILATIILAVLTAALIGFGIFPGPVLAVIRAATLSLL